MRNKQRQVCTRCIMDTTDPEIIFDAQGICNHCHNFDEVISKHWFPNAEGKQKLEVLVAQLKKEGEGKAYDCILGLSGGLDSSYLALVMKDYGLRPLAVHIDAGWNSEDAVKNINTVVDYCGFKLHTKVVDWEEVKDLQLAYLKAGVENQDVVQDHAFFANLYHFAIDNKIKSVISGSNIATEAVLPSSWQHDAMDAINLKDIHKKFGLKKLKKYKTISFLQYYLTFPYFYKMKVYKPLNYMDYSKEIALLRLEPIGYVSYDRKHGESTFTRFFQNYYLPKRFGIDKRVAHLSSLILTGILSREEALDKIKEPLYDLNELATDMETICSNLSISLNKLEGYISQPTRKHSEFKSWKVMHKTARKIKIVLGL